MSVGEYEREGIGAAPDPETLLAFEIALRLHADRLRIRPRLVPIVAPAAGAEWSVQVPGGVTWVPLSFRGILTTSATVLNRGAMISYSDGQTVWAQSGPYVLQAASLAWGYSWLRGGVTQTNNNFLAQATGLPFGVPLPQNTVVASVTGNLQVGDQWSSITAYVLEIRERQYEERASAFRAIMQGAHVDSYPGVMLGL